MDALNPPPSLLAKVGSILVHAEEATEAGGHQFDVIAARQLVGDPEVQEWLGKMRALAMVPVKRSEPPRAKNSPTG